MSESVDMIKVFKGAISKEDCQTVVNLLEKADFNYMDRFETDFWKNRILASKAMPKEITEIINKVLMETYPKIKELYNIDIDPPINWEGLVHRHYANDNGDDDSLPLHHDDYTDNYYAVSLVIYWNDNFEGGEVEFPEFNYTYKPSAGDMLVFLPTKQYMHKVHRMISGTRYASPYWYRFKGNK